MAGGLSEARLQRLHDVMAGHVERGALPGLVTAVARRGEAHLDTLGTLAFGAGEPMRTDTIFRISSMSKPITAVAGLILVEECRLRLDDPVDDLLPELAGRRVLKAIDGELDDTVPASRPISVRDLLTFRMGFGMIFGPPDAYPIQRSASFRALGAGPPQPAHPPPPDEWMAALGSLPLLHQPGERWMYHTGSDVLGVLIARVAGQPFETFLRERIFDPLGMKDTAFSVPPEKLDRLATSYAAGDPPELYDGVADSQWGRSPAFPSGGAGLVSTIEDYLAFGRMLLAGGGPILARPTVEAMTTDQLTREQKADSAMSPGFWDARGWGFGVSVVTRRTDATMVPGRYGWDGGLGTAWSSDPREQLVAILMTQRAEYPVESSLHRDFWSSVYSAIDD